MKTLRALLVLGRVSNLPTIWSNCLCGWLLGKGYTGSESLDWWVFAMLVIGASGVYLGGMYLNDACDVAWDSEHRPERPIPSGVIHEKAVWAIGIGLMAGGMFFLCLPGGMTALLALLLFNMVLTYNFLHKRLSWSPGLIALCRLLLILMAASYGHVNTGSSAPFFQMPVAGLATWTALALFAYVAGLSVLAKAESEPGEKQYWPVALMLIPVGVAMLANPGEMRGDAIILSLILGLWMLRSLRTTYWVEKEKRDVGRSVSGLLAGIVLVDLLAVMPVVPREEWALAAIFLCCFGLSLAAQKFVPAT